MFVCEGSLLVGHGQHDTGQVINKDKYNHWGKTILGYLKQLGLISSNYKDLDDESQK